MERLEIKNKAVYKSAIHHVITACAAMFGLFEKEGDSQVLFCFSLRG